VILSVCLSRYRQTFFNCYSSYWFSLILTKLGIHDLCANAHKTVEQILILNFWLIFETLHLELVSAAAAAELSRPTGFTSSNDYTCIHQGWPRASVGGRHVGPGEPTGQTSERTTRRTRWKHNASAQLACGAFFRERVILLKNVAGVSISTCLVCVCVSGDYCRVRWLCVRDSRPDDRPVGLVLAVRSRRASLGTGATATPSITSSLLSVVVECLITEFMK